MSDCPNCGHAVNPRARYCETCGSALILSEQTAMSAVHTVAVSASHGGISVMLLSTGALAPDSAADAIAEVCGYAREDARLIAKSAPVAVATGLNAQQAARVARECCRLGLEVTAYDSGGYVNEALYAVEREGAQGVPCGLRDNNRIAKHLMRPWNIPYQFEGDKPPVYR